MNKSYYDAGYKAGCDYLAKTSNLDLLDHYDLNNWDVCNEIEESLSFSEGFSAAYGCEEEDDFDGIVDFTCYNDLRYIEEQFDYNYDQDIMLWNYLDDPIGWSFY